MKKKKVVQVKRSNLRLAGLKTCCVFSPMSKISWIDLSKVFGYFITIHDELTFDYYHIEKPE